MQESTKLKLLLLGLFLAVLGIVLPGSTSTTAGVQYVLNTTNLAPSSSHSVGTGERVADNTTYWANSSALFVSIKSHANTSGTNTEIHLFINGTKYQDESGKPLGVAEDNNKSIFHIIPQYSYYSVTITNYHHYNWFETKILTGDVTTTISTSGGIAGITDHANLTNLNWLNANHTIDAPIDMNFNTIKDAETVRTNGVLVVESTGAGPDTSYLYLDYGSNTMSLMVKNTSSNQNEIVVNVNETIFSKNINMSNKNITSVHVINTTESELVLAPNIGNYSFNSTDANWNGANLTGVSNITGLKSLNNDVMSINGTNGGRVGFNDNLTYYANTSGYKKWSNDYLFDYLFQESSDMINFNNLVSFQAINNTGFNFFQGRRARGVINYENKSAIIEPVQTNDILFRVVGVGWNGEVWSGTSAAVDFTADGNFNATSMPTRLDFQTRGDTGGSVVRVTVNKSGNTHHFGNISVNPTNQPSGITMYSADGNDWCLRISNAGAIDISSSPCV